MPFDAVRMPIAAAAWLIATAAAAQVNTPRPPDAAGRLLQETRPPATSAPSVSTPAKRLIETPTRPTVEMPEGVTVTPSGFRITGAVSLPEADLAELVKPWVGRKLDLAGLNEAAGAITRRYQAAGHFLSYAYLPAQKVADGVIEIAVLEGRIESSEVAHAPEVRLRDEVIEAHVAPLIDLKPLRQADVERQMLLLNDMPGVVARAAFTPGASAGGAEMVVSIAEDEPVVVDVGVDNHGSPSSGSTRLGVGLQLRDLFGLGDDTQARLTVSHRGRLVSGSLGTWVPVGGNGLKLGAALSMLTYSLGGTFADLGSTGAAQSLLVRASYPFVRRQTANLMLETDLEYKRLRDDLVLVGNSNPKRSVQVRGTLAGDWRDRIGGGGVSSGSLSVVSGDLRLLDSTAAASDASGLHTAGSFKKANLTLSREQTLWGPMSAYVRYGGQIARSNLDSSEKLDMGGPYGVRAYAPGEAVVDDARMLALELRWAMDYLGGSMQWSLFRDLGWGRINVNPLAQAASTNEAHLGGTGIGLRWNVGDLGISAAMAWRSTREPTADGGDPSPRVYFQLVYLP